MFQIQGCLDSLARYSSVESRWISKLSMLRSEYTNSIGGRDEDSLFIGLHCPYDGDAKEPQGCRIGNRIFRSAALPSGESVDN